MTSPTALGTGLAAKTAGWARLGGFVLGIFAFVPVFFFLEAVKSPRAAKVPMQFHRFLCRLLGMRVRVRDCSDGACGRDTPVLFVCNHSSYLDIPVLGGVLNGRFVAKSEVASWPFIGAMSKLQNTVFIERRAVRAAQQKDVLRENLEQGHSLILFPEGTSSDGMRTLPFKSSLFSIAEKPLPDGRQIKIQPVSILCTEIGGMPIGRSWRPYYAWFGDMTLVKHVWDVFKIADFTVDIILHEPVTIEDFENRKLLSDFCQRKIAAGVDQCVTGRFHKELAAVR